MTGCFCRKSNGEVVSDSLGSPAMRWSMQRRHVGDGADGNWLALTWDLLPLPWQICMWFLSNPSAGLALAEFFTACFRGRNIFPTPTGSLWQGFHMDFNRLFHGHWLGWSKKLSYDNTISPTCVCRTHHWCLGATLSLICFFQSSVINSFFLVSRRHRSQLLFLKIPFISCCY